MWSTVKHWDYSSLQLILLEDAWRELFVLGIAQWAIPVDSTTLLAVSGVYHAQNVFLSPHTSNLLVLSCMMTSSPYPLIGMNTENTESPRMNKIMSEIQALQEVVTRFRQMRLDATEFACLKCIVTFKAGESGYPDGIITAILVCALQQTSFKLSPFLAVPTHGSTELRSFRNASAIAALQDEAQLTLNSYIHTRWDPTQKDKATVPLSCEQTPAATFIIKLMRQ